jgi:LPS sulfotransferase NodH
MWATRWGIVERRGRFEYADFLRHALVEGRTRNGVFAARLMWGTIGELVEQIAPLFPDDQQAADVDVLRRAFGRVRFISLSREDVVAQAVSWSRAEQTNVWHETIEATRVHRTTDPRFDRRQIDDLVSQIEEHNGAWQDWFAAAGIRPYEVRYEVLARDPITTTCGVLDHLGLEPAPGRLIEVRHRRLSDHVNAEWIARYGTRP